MTWTGISDYLSRFRNLKAPEDFLKEKISSVINDVLKIIIKLEEIEVRNAVIFIKTKNPALKNTIFLNKEKILEKLSQKLGKNSPTDLRF
ncbi:DUF721 domain-containing protein [Patescibacteria group bacterium]|nr:DUF721 domain-containing protein [Patescibacteria group bacterium]